MNNSHHIIQIFQITNKDTGTKSLKVNNVSGNDLKSGQNIHPNVCSAVRWRRWYFVGIIDDISSLVFGSQWDPGYKMVSLNRFSSSPTQTRHSITGVMATSPHSVPVQKVWNPPIGETKGYSVRPSVYPLSPLCFTGLALEGRVPPPFPIPLLHLRRAIRTVIRRKIRLPTTPRYLLIVPREKDRYGEHSIRVWPISDYCRNTPIKRKGTISATMPLPLFSTTPTSSKQTIAEEVSKYSTVSRQNLANLYRQNFAIT